MKAVSDLYAPVSGTVTEVNGELATAPEKINKDAHSAWMIKITLKNPAELNALLSAADYEKFVAEEGWTLIRAAVMTPAHSTIELASRYI